MNFIAESDIEMKQVSLTIEVMIGLFRDLAVEDDPELD